MMKHFVGAVSVFAFAGAAQAAEKTYDLDAFDSVSVNRAVEMDVTVGPAFSVKAEFNDAYEKRVILKVEEGTLVASVGKKGLFKRGGRHNIKVTVTMPELREVEVSTAAELEVSGINAESLNIEASTGASAPFCQAPRRAASRPARAAESGMRAMWARSLHSVRASGTIDAGSG